MGEAAAETTGVVRGLRWMTGIVEHFRSGNLPTQGHNLAKNGHETSLVATELDAEDLCRAIRTHLAHTQMTMASHEHGYDLLIPGHCPISFPQMTAANDHPEPLPRFYEETTTLVLSYLVSRFRPAVLFDIGAGHGYFSRVAASYAGSTVKAYAFEVRPSRIEQIKANIEKDPFRTRVLPELVGLTDVHKGLTDIWYKRSILFETRPEVADLRERWRWLKLNLRNGMARHFETAKIMMTSIDHVVETRGLRPDILKIDVEGYEGRVLKGARKTLARRHPFILLEIHKDKKLRFVGRRRDVVAPLFDLGYRALFLTDHHDRLKCEVVEVERGDPLLDRQETDLILFFHPDYRGPQGDADASRPGP